MRPHSSSAALCLALTALVAGSPAPASVSYWPHDPRTPIRMAGFGGTDPTSYAAVSDGAGGAFLIWVGTQSGNKDIYATRVRADGSLDPAWPAGGLAVCNAVGDQTNPRAQRDASGACYVCWSDARTGVARTYVTRLLANGAIAAGFPANGLVVDPALANADSPPQLYADPYIGAQLLWEYATAPGNHDIYGAGVNSNGTLAWMHGLVTTPTNQTNPVLSFDPSVMSFAWVDGGNTIMAGRFSEFDGTIFGGFVTLSNPAYTNTSPRMSTTGGSGNVVVWIATNGAGSAPAGMYFFGGQPRNNLGLLAPQTAATVTLGDLVDSGSYTSWLLWNTSTTPQAFNLQQVSPGGFLAPFTVATHVDWTQSSPQLCPDGAGGVLVAYNDVLGGTEGVNAQRFLANGALAPLWGVPGGDGTSVVQGIVSLGAFFGAVTSDGSSGAIVTSRDGFFGPGVYVNRVDRWGALDGAPAIVSVRDVPNDQGGRVRVTWNASYLDLPYAGGVASYWLWRQVPASVALARVRGGAPQERSESSEPPAAGTIRMAPDQALGYAWEFVASQVADGFAQYSYAATTLGDSVAAGNPRTVFMVEARSSSVNVGWPSLPDSGYSVDNLPPVAPSPFTGQYAAGATHLHWGPNAEADLAGYRLYRGASAGFAPGPGSLVTATPDTGFVDTGAAGSWYKLSAVDAHGNESAYAVLSPGGTTAVGDGGAPGQLSFARPGPDPAFESTQLRFVLPRAGPVSLVVLDAAGRSVRTLLDGDQPPGGHSVIWDLRNGAGAEMPAGLYFARLRFERRSLTARIVTLR